METRLETGMVIHRKFKLHKVGSAFFQSYKSSSDFVQFDVC